MSAENRIRIWKLAGIFGLLCFAMSGFALDQSDAQSTVKPPKPTHPVIRSSKTTASSASASHTSGSHTSTSHTSKTRRGKIEIFGGAHATAKMRVYTSRPQEHGPGEERRENFFEGFFEDGEEARPAGH